MTDPLDACLSDMTPADIERLVEETGPTAVTRVIEDLLSLLSPLYSYDAHGMKQARAMVHKINLCRPAYRPSACI